MIVLERVKVLFKLANAWYHFLLRVKWFFFCVLKGNSYKIKSQVDHGKTVPTKYIKVAKITPGTIYI